MAYLLHPFTYTFIVQELNGIPYEKWNELEIIKRLYEISYFYDIPLRFIERTFPAALHVAIEDYTTIAKYLCQLSQDDAINKLEKFKEEQFGSHQQWVIRPKSFDKSLLKKPDLLFKKPEKKNDR